jgi:two-component system, NtrC family, sensor kinase
LNFVNNFSELNMELVHEINQELTKIPAPTSAKQNLYDLLNDLQHNEQKIQHHGKRADGIVKNMLQHSRKTTGQKELTDINALADEYLRLSYHGLRAKDKSFNATIETQFDKNIGEIMVVPQEISRVLLNLFNNAFYAVDEHLKKSGNAYAPAVWVSTKKLDHNVEIRIQDNGMGISQSVMDKIFQPFFTTKPAGQGTGLGLSLSYDIIKAHGGEIKVQSTEGEGSTFIIVIPT